MNKEDIEVTIKDIEQLKLRESQLLRLRGNINDLLDERDALKQQCDELQRRADSLEKAYTLACASRRRADEQRDELLTAADACFEDILECGNISPKHGKQYRQARAAIAKVEGRQA